MKTLNQKFGTWFLLMLYCLTISSVFAVPTNLSLQIETSVISEECRSLNSFDHADHTGQWELQLKTIKEKAEFSGHKKFQEDNFHLSFSGFLLVEKIESIGISKEKETFPFSGTDIIFPFHNFW